MVHAREDPRNKGDIGGKGAKEPRLMRCASCVLVLLAAVAILGAALIWGERGWRR